MLYGLLVTIAQSSKNLKNNLSQSGNFVCHVSAVEFDSDLILRFYAAEVVIGLEYLHCLGTVDNLDLVLLLCFIG